MRIGVTGASGFVARELIPMLLVDGHEVAGIARRQPQPASEGTPEGFRFRAGDVRDPAAMRATVEGCEVVIHLASSFSPLDTLSDIVVRGMRCVVDASREAGVARIVFVSCLGAEAAAHSELYRAKWEAESILRGSEVPFTILRPSLVLGRDDGVVRPLAAVLREWPAVPVPGRGLDRQQPIDVLDLCRCVVKAMSDGDLKGEMVSVGGPMFLTFRQLVDLIAGELGLVPRKALIPPRALPALLRFLPERARPLYAPPSIARFQQGVVASPGIVEAHFGFAPTSIIPRLVEYLA